MPTYRWNSALKKFVDKQTGEPMPVKDENAICKPYIISDIDDYLSPVCGPDGKHKVVGGRAGQREDLKATGSYLMDPPKDKKTGTTRGYKNPRFAAKHGLPLNEETRDKLKI